MHPFRSNTVSLNHILLFERVKKLFRDQPHGVLLISNAQVVLCYLPTKTGQLLQLEEHVIELARFALDYFTQLKS